MLLLSNSNATLGAFQRPSLARYAWCATPQARIASCVGSAKSQGGLSHPRKSSSGRFVTASYHNLPVLPGRRRRSVVPPGLASYETFGSIDRTGAAQVLQVLRWNGVANRARRFCHERTERPLRRCVGPTRIPPCRTSQSIWK
ncbi:protein of unknown function [Bradyrhizobium vignae]|uniref:Uncharacterized protein n=1 Tax=Bradyrhizobium vignae TaxID=1549949 RepID=A0A2U3Q1G1_9BRAD|nr:protein of unknown function [Bradyrhizobium vignae]